MRVGTALGALALAVSLLLTGGCDVRTPRPKAEAATAIISLPAPKNDAAGAPPEKVHRARAPVSRELVPMTLTEAERRERNARVFALFLTLLPAFHGEASTATSLGRGRR
jgi:hypothetical protein